MVNLKKEEPKALTNGVKRLEKTEMVRGEGFAPKFTSKKLSSVKL